ncbi:MAG: hypothetical protein GY852_07510 [bacterium]|nr:hypothetical protein [bacterium]
MGTAWELERAIRFLVEHGLENRNVKLQASGKAVPAPGEPEGTQRKGTCKVSGKERENRTNLRWTYGSLSGT